MSLWYMFYGADLVGTDTIYIYIYHIWESEALGVLALQEVADVCGYLV